MQELTINAIGAQGDGLARFADGKPAFVPLTLPGETILANMEGARGEVAEILKASAERVAAPCKHFGHSVGSFCDPEF